VLDAEALLPDDDMPKVLDFDVLPDDNNNDMKWHGAAPFCLIFFVFSKRTWETRSNYARLRFSCNSRRATTRPCLQFKRNVRCNRTTHVYDVL
jgi:hypothetical protein